MDVGGLIQVKTLGVNEIIEEKMGKGKTLKGAQR